MPNPPLSFEQALEYLGSTIPKMSLEQEFVQESFQRLTRGTTTAQDIAKAAIEFFGDCFDIMSIDGDDSSAQLALRPKAECQNRKLPLFISVTVTVVGDSILISVQ